jgi:hypothetical protein
LAHNCADRIDQESIEGVRAEALFKLGDGFERLGNCAKRSSANLRHELDQSILALLRQTDHDPETLEALLNEADRIFTKYSAEEPAKTALSALGSRDDEDDFHWIDLKSGLQALPSTSHRRMEDVLDNLANSADDKLTASQIFFELASACVTNGIVSQSQIAPALVEYVKAVADLWRAHDLNPSRVHYETDPNAVSPFHRFADLVLTGIVEPWARRYDDDLAAHARAIREAYDRLPEECRAVSTPGLRRADVERMINDDHVKKALNTPVQKSGPKTP